MRAMGVISRVKIKITYTEEEQQLFERVRAELLQTMPTARQHESKAPAGTKIFYITRSEEHTSELQSRTDISGMPSSA